MPVCPVPGSQSEVVEWGSCPPQGTRGHTSPSPDRVSAPASPTPLHEPTSVPEHSLAPEPLPRAGWDARSLGTRALALAAGRPRLPLCSPRRSSGLPTQVSRRRPAVHPAPSSQRADPGSPQTRTSAPQTRARMGAPARTRSSPTSASAPRTSRAGTARRVRPHSLQMIPGGAGGQGPVRLGAGWEASVKLV